MATYANSTMYNINGKETLVDKWVTDDEDGCLYQNIARDGCIPLDSDYTIKQTGMIFLLIKTELISHLSFAFPFRNAHYIEN